MNGRKLLTLAFAAALAAPIAAQQHTNQSRGFDSRSVFQVGDVDAINLFNGALTVTIPLGPRFPVGPTDYGFGLVYNSNAWSVREVCVSQGGTSVAFATAWPIYECVFGQYLCTITGYLPPLVWGAPQDDYNPRPGTDCSNLALPNPVSNAGLGWQLNFGKLLPPRANQQDRSPNANESLSWVYVGVDGAEHSFDGVDGTGTKDGDFLRMVSSTNCLDGTWECRKVEFPDGGEEHYKDFGGSSGPDWRLTRRQDRFGNGFTVTYVSPLLWLVTDTEERSHQIELALDSASYQPVVKRLLLEASDDKTLELELEHQVRSVPRGAPHNDPGAGPDLTVPLLEFVRLRELGTATELSRFSMTPVETAYFFQDDQGPPLVRRPVQIPGVLRRLELPTGAQLDWRFGTGYRYPNGSGGRRNLRSTTGVRERTITDVGGTTIGRWTYEPQLTLLDEATYSDCGDLAIQSGQGFPFEARCHEKHFQNTVTNPVGTKSVHHFSVYSLPSDSAPGSVLFTPEGWNRGEYGLPLSRHESVEGMFLSTEVYPSGATSPVRKTYVRYDSDDGTAPPDGWGGDLRNNHRPAATRTVYFDDPVPNSDPPQYRYRESVSSNYAGFGRYRRTDHRSGGAWPSGSGQADAHRVEFTDWQPDEDAWVADLYTRQSAREGSRQGQVQSQFGVVSGTRGYALTATRRLYNDTISGSLTDDLSLATSSKDLLTVLTYDANGNVTWETSWGADRQALAPVAENGSNLFAPPGGSAGARIKHSYSEGVRSKSEIVDPCRGDNAVVFKTLDLIIDPRSGLPTSSKDAADVSTTYKYDVLGRLVEEKAAETDKTVYQHLLQGSSVPPPVGNGAQVIATTGSCCEHYRRSRWHYDGLGRLVQESRDMPGLEGTPGSAAIANRFYSYNGLGWPTEESTWRYGSANFTGLERALEMVSGSTKYQSFDTFGRAGRIEPPEGSQHAVVVSRTGDRVVTSTAKVATGTNGAETSVSRTEEYDAFGRLVSVNELSGPGATQVTTTYRYDAGNRLIRAETISGGVTQARSFDYDGLGFLREETHPEIGPAGNGTMKLGFYDVRGNVGTREIAGLTGTNRRGLDYRYDAAGRLIEVFDVRDVQSGSPTKPPLQQFFYGTANINGGQQKGKLVRTRQWQPETGLWVAEDFTYQGLGGRMSARAVKLIGDPAGSPRFSQQYTYTPLGELASVSYPHCQATEGSCEAATNAVVRTVDFVYQRSLPWGVTTSVTTSPGATPTTTGLAGPLLYSAHGGVRQIPHSNSVTDTVTNDLQGQARPRRIAFAKGEASHWDSGTIQYDGAGNLWGIGAAGEAVPQQRFQYDGVSRLIDGQVRRQGQAGLSREQISYDAFGNWTSRTVNGFASAIPAVQAATNRFSGEGVGYDASGNLLQWSVISPRLKYDLHDRVIERTDGPTTWRYLYTAAGERVIEKNADTGLQRWTLRGPEEQVLRTMERQPNGQWSLLRDNLFLGRRLLAAQSSAGLHHFHLDHLGSIRLETDAAGSPIKYRDFLPFGESLDTPGLTENRLLFTGHQRDDMATTGTADDLDYMHARYCSPTFGRFLSVDPVLGRAAAPQSWNRYAYVRGNPVKLVDPDGRLPDPFQLVEGWNWLANKLVSAWIHQTERTYELLKTPDGQRTFMLMHAFPAVTPMVAEEEAVLTNRRANGRPPIGSVAPEVLLAKARVVRDSRAAEVGPLSPRLRPATVTAGYNLETGQVAAACSGGGVCAEVRVVQALGGDSSVIHFTEAVRPRPQGPYREVPVCPVCEELFGRDAFPLGTLFRSDGN